MKTILTAAFIALTTTSAFAHDSIQITGSSTVLPFATIAAEAFGENTNSGTPIVEGGGTGAGIKKFCEGVGDNTVDIADASRQMKDEEKALCVANGVTEITEVRLGYDGIVFATDINGAPFALTPSEVYLAINKDSITATWNVINPDLPNQKILMLVPGTKHGTREVFDQKVVLQGCKDTGKYDEFLATLTDPKAAEKECTSLRTDGTVVEIDGDYTETLNRLKTDTDAVGVFGLSFYKNNTATLQVATVNGVEPTVETIADGSYPVSRPLYFYVKNAHLGSVPGLADFVKFFVSDEMAGPDGALVEDGLVSDPKLADTQQSVDGLN